MNLSDLVADNLQRRILNEEWVVGEKIPSEEKLSEEFDVNRLTVRLAINKLNVLGILETRTGEGTFVKKFDLYHYINQTLPFLFSRQDMGQIRDFENFVLEVGRKMMPDDTEGQEIAQQFIDHYQDLVERARDRFSRHAVLEESVVQELSYAFWEIKENCAQNVSNDLIVSLYVSLKEVLVAEDVQNIRDLLKNGKKAWDLLKDRAKKFSRKEPNE